MRIKYTPEMLKTLVATSNSISEVIRQLGLKEAGGNHAHLSRRIKDYGISTAHFKRYTDYLRHGCNKKNAAQILVLRKSGRRAHADQLRRVMQEAGISYNCAKCQIPAVYNGQPLTLEINHKNGNWLDNRKDNLEFLCPNCHSQYHNKSRR